MQMLKIATRKSTVLMGYFQPNRSTVMWPANGREPLSFRSTYARIATSARCVMPRFWV